MSNINNKSEMPHRTSNVWILITLHLFTWGDLMYRCPQLKFLRAMFKNFLWTDWIKSMYFWFLHHYIWLSLNESSLTEYNRTLLTRSYSLFMDCYEFCNFMTPKLAVKIWFLDYRNYQNHSNPRMSNDSLKKCFSNEHSMVDN